jgi:hypothetical protein
LPGGCQPAEDVDLALDQPLDLRPLHLDDNRVAVA